ncbi:DUF4192 domain-containing protein [Pseudarthrobacter sp. NamB4]|uniref:DUF4192 domain-containing protein n=1 Tax=Pseudarthrobacter sp. NamB4 TaxID=2576837 RepID=UPI0010FF27D9|nr:DUF4192 domain-containing protein [Pseudarthrobacter sp. NamB4]TLM72555.1 DUF4192 family protein [Pseudarthrobacter sp. NamB4]
MTPSERLTVRGPEDILGFIPHSLGYWPANSLVAMTLQGKSLGATLRLDLPDRDVLAAPSKYLRAVRRYLEADKEADGTLLAIFTGNGGAAAPSMYDGLLAGLDSMLERAGLPVREAWYVGKDYWRDAWCIDVSCCPLPGRPIQQIRDSLLSTEMVYRGSSVGPPPEDRSAPGPLSAIHSDAVLEAEVVWSAQLDLRRQSRPQFNAVLRQWEAALARRPADPGRPPVHSAAFLRATLLVPAWRDAVLVMAAAGKAAATAGAEEFGIFAGDVELNPLEPPAEDAGRETVPVGSRDCGPPSFAMAAGDMDVDRESLLMPAGLPETPGHGPGTPGYGEVLMGQAPAVPQWPTLDSLDLVLGQLALPGGAPAAAALTGRGWIAWCRGRGSYAAAFLGEALEIEPGYRLAGLLLELVRRGTLCGWASRKDAAWQKFGPDAE